MSPQEPAPRKRSDDDAPLAPLGGSAEGAPDLSRAVTDMRRLLDQLETAARGNDNDAAQQPLAVMARMLQYVHDSHARIVQTLENQDRSELFLQSTQALNQTFRRLNQSQDALVDKLLAERRRNPWYLVLGASIVAVVVVVAIFLLIDHRNGGLRDEVDRMASARDGLTAVVADSQRSFHEMGSKLAETVDKTLAANRVLDNENRAKAKELEAMRAEFAAAIARRDELAREKETRDDRLAGLERERSMLETKIEELRTRLLDRELAAAKFEELLDQRLGKVDSGRAAKDPAATEANSPPAPSEAPPAADPAPAAEPGLAEPKTDPESAGAPPIPDTGTAGAAETGADSEVEPPPSAEEPAAPAANDGAADPAAGADPAASAAENEAARDERIAAEARFDLTTQAVNDFLAAAGVIDHRLLRHSGARNGELSEVTLELRDSSGAPVGFQSAAGMKIVVDPTALSARLVLRDGETVVRGERTPFQDGTHAVEIAAVAPQSFTTNELLPFLVLAAPEPAPGEQPVPQRRFDPREPLALLNAAISASGRAHVRFARLGGIDLGRLVDVELNHYSGAGSLQKTVAARSCTIEIDEAARRVTLVFRDGIHRMKGRETPFFAGRGQESSEAAWRLDLDDADVPRWIALKERLRTERFVE